MWTFARGSENILITSETTGWKLQPVVSLRVITTIELSVKFIKAIEKLTDKALSSQQRRDENICSKYTEYEIFNFPDRTKN